MCVCVRHRDSRERERETETERQRERTFEENEQENLHTLGLAEKEKNLNFTIPTAATRLIRVQTYIQLEVSTQESDSVTEGNSPCSTFTQENMNKGAYQHQSRAS